jgi:hypothetical protein
MVAAVATNSQKNYQGIFFIRSTAAQRWMRNFLKLRRKQKHTLQRAQKECT